ncbi:hypothetical protein KCP76_16285 [Salmonella enterica subsp. enterica serovar Weltevreden]|nr:hypothetical protein KCP76_16285 [Salmonella enterica subsp. enterica serovar Weltevreden]
MRSDRAKDSQLIGPVWRRLLRVYCVADKVTVRTRAAATSGKWRVL